MLNNLVQAGVRRHGFSDGKSLLRRIQFKIGVQLVRRAVKMLRKCLPHLTTDEVLLLTGVHPENEVGDQHFPDSCTDVSEDDVINKIFGPCTDEDEHEGTDFVHSSVAAVVAPSAHQ